MREVDLCRFRLELLPGDEDGQYVLVLKDMIDEIYDMGAMVDLSKAATYEQAADILAESAGSFARVFDCRK